MMIEHLLLQAMPANLLIINRLVATAYTAAMSINASGQIVGDYNSGHGFLYSGGTYTTISVPGAMGTEAFGINASGHIVGLHQEKASDGHILTHGYFYINGAYASFDCPLTTYLHRGIWHQRCRPNCRELPRHQPQGHPRLPLHQRTLG